MLSQNWEGRHLDKDILVPGNKVYSPDRCLFVPREVNNLFSSSSTKDPLSAVVCAPKFPTGVYKSDKGVSFYAKISKFGETVYLGSFASPERAYLAYRKAKGQYILQIANSLTDISDIGIRNALKMRAAEFVDVRWYRSRTNVSPPTLLR
jgi:hypothetical protein